MTVDGQILDASNVQLEGIVFLVSFPLVRSRLPIGILRFVAGCMSADSFPLGYGFAFFWVAVVDKDQLGRHAVAQA